MQLYKLPSIDYLRLRFHLKALKENHILWFDLTLIGNTIDFLPFVVFSIFQLDPSGSGVGRHQFDLSAAYCFQPENENQDQESDSNSSQHENWRLLY